VDCATYTPIAITLIRDYAAIFKFEIYDVWDQTDVHRFCQPEGNEIWLYLLNLPCSYLILRLKKTAKQLNGIKGDDYVTIQYCAHAQGFVIAGLSESWGTRQWLVKHEERAILARKLQDYFGIIVLTGKEIGLTPFRHQNLAEAINDATEKPGVKKVNFYNVPNECFKQLCQGGKLCKQQERVKRPKPQGTKLLTKSHPRMTNKRRQFQLDSDALEAYTNQTRRPGRMAKDGTLKALPLHSGSQSEIEATINQAIKNEEIQYDKNLKMPTARQKRKEAQERQAQTA
jgi:hypothetical protein